MSAQAFTLYWTPWDEPGCEQVHVSSGPDGTTALGLIVRMKDAAHHRCRYRLDMDAQWRLRELAFAVTSGADEQPKRILLESDGQGNWRQDGESAPDFDGCLDVDIQVTPFTNSLPIRRLGLEQGESADLRVVYLPMPELAPRVAEQRYTCLQPLGAAGGLYLYEGLFRGFTAELPVDRSGFVLDYPETFRRSWPA